MMLLLDLPPEVFARVVAHLVTGAGISEAWDCRKVCRTFRRAIEYETLAEQPTRAFLRRGCTRAKNILRQNMALYLSYRMTAEKDAYSFLPRFMNKVLDVVCKSLPDCSHQLRRSYARTLCRLIVEKKSDEVQRLLTIKKPETTSRCRYFISWFTEEPLSTYVAAAAKLGNLKVLRTMLGIDADRIWTESHIFGFPLVAAAASGHTEIVRAIVKHFERTQHRAHMATREPAFREAVIKAFGNEHSEIALLLLRIYHAYASPVWPATFKYWMASAIRMRNRTLILLVQRLRQAGELDAANGFEQACSDNDLKAVRMFVEEGLVPLHCRSSKWHGYTPIQIAVKSRNAKAVGLVLQMGADPNGEYVYRSIDRPLWIAIENKDQEIVRMLLKHGANPTFVQKAWNEKPESWQDERNNIDLALSLAEFNRRYYIRPTTPRTNFAADGPDLVLSE